MITKAVILEQEIRDLQIKLRDNAGYGKWEQLQDRFKHKLLMIKGFIITYKNGHTKSQS